jgi:hypothetical protein
MALCCGRPMIFTGALERQQLANHAAEHCQSIEDTMLQVFGGAPPDVPHVLAGLASGRVCTYGFRCRDCNKIRGHWDTD